MKKTISIFLMLVIVLGSIMLFFGCEDDNKNQQTIPSLESNKQLIEDNIDDANRPIDPPHSDLIGNER